MGLSFASMNPPTNNKERKRGVLPQEEMEEIRALADALMLIGGSIDVKEFIRRRRSSPLEERPNTQVK